MPTATIEERLTLLEQKVARIAPAETDAAPKPAWTNVGGEWKRIAAQPAFVEGTTTKIVEVVEAKYAHELTPEQVQRELPHLPIAQIYAALADYHAHKSEFDAQIAERHRFADALRDAELNPVTREQLQARRQSAA